MKEIAPDIIIPRKYLKAHFLDKRGIEDKGWYHKETKVEPNKRLLKRVCDTLDNLN